MWSIHLVSWAAVCLICVPFDKLNYALPLVNHATNLREQHNDGEIANNKDLAGGLRMFPKLSRTTTKMRPESTNKLLQLWANSGKEGRAERNYPGKELTIPIPKFNTDVMGNWVFNPWAVTYGDIWLDTRFHNLDKPVVPRITIDHFGATHYYPKNQNPSTVCYGKSTIYNIPKVEAWLKRVEPNHSYEHRPFFMQLRREIFAFGKSEECHGKEYDDWRKYQECTIRRNMRMEYMIPKYPLHQINTYYEVTEEP